MENSIPLSREELKWEVFSSCNATREFGSCIVLDDLDRVVIEIGVSDFIDPKEAHSLATHIVEVHNSLPRSHFEKMESLRREYKKRISSNRGR